MREPPVDTTASGGWQQIPVRILAYWPVFLVLVVDFYAVWFIGSEHTLYHADQVTFWSYSRNLAAAFASHPIAAVFSIARSVAEQDLNLLPAVPIAFAFLAFGSSRLVYVLAVITIYGLATVSAFAYALHRINDSLEIGGRNIAATWAALLSIILFSTIWRPIFIGYLGIGGVALGCVALALYLADSTRNQPSRTFILIGALVALVVVFRRWYALWSVAFCVMVAADVAWRFLAERIWSRQSFRKAFRGPVVIGASAVLALLVLSPIITISRLQTDYADRFSAYGLDLSLSQRIGSVIHEFGLFILLILTGCAILLLCDRATRRIAALLVLQLAVTYLGMVSLQDHSPQHWYLYYPSAMLLVGIGLARVLSPLPTRKWTRTVVLGVMGVAIVSLLAVYFPAVRVAADRLEPLVPANRLQPRIREDLQEVDRLLNFLDERLIYSPGYTYVLASSETLSEQVLAFANLSLGTRYRCVRTFLGSAHVDKRDGFPFGLLEAETVLVAEPVQYHLRPEDQQVIGIPAFSLLNEKNIGAAFQRLPVRFELRDGVSVFVFDRVRAPQANEVAAMSALFAEAYPDRPEIYSSIRSTSPPSSRSR